jgi:hypothetical protein
MSDVAYEIHGAHRSVKVNPLSDADININHGAPHSYVVP